MIGFLNFLKTLFKGILSNILFVSLFFGFLFLAFGYTDMIVNGDSNIKELFKVAGSIILSSGVFMAITKSYQFSNIFKDELRKVIYSQEHLEKREDLDTIWNTITEALCKQKFEPINKKLAKNIKDYYLPINQDYYYKNYNLDVDIEHDKENPGYILLNEETKVTVVVENKSAYTYKFRGTIPFPDDDNKRTFHHLEEFIVNGIKIDFNKNDLLTEKREGNSITTSFSYKCDTGKKEYDIVRREQRRYSLKSNPYRSHKAICLYHNFYLDLTYPKDINVEFIDMGVLGSFSKNRKDNQTYNRIKAQYIGLIFRNQGLMLTYS